MAATATDSRYEAKKAAFYDRDRASIRRSQDVYFENNEPVPLKVANVKRRKKAAKSLKFHLETYHKETFTSPWADYHHVLLERLETAIYEGGWFALAVPRGGGKSSICEGAVEWATLHGHKQFPVLIGATDKKATDRLKNIKHELRFNDLLLADFPEVCRAVRHIEGRSVRCSGQIWQGEPTDIAWNVDQIVFPTVELPKKWPFKPVGGSRIAVAGITGDIRGFAQKTKALEILRPDFAVPDDPQSRESAKSYQQSLNRMQVVTGDVAYLNGPGKKMSVVVPCTVIFQGDMADQLLDRTTNPQWHGERHRMVVSFPDKLDLWDEYAEVLRDCQRRDVSTQPATDFYAKNRKEMDAGAKVSWEHRYNDDELSALQNAMNLRIRNEQAFNAECQNEPTQQADVDAVICSPHDIIVKQSHLATQMPLYAEKIVAHVDIHEDVFYESVVCASDAFEACVTYYGTYPDQDRHYFHKREDLRALKHIYDASRLETRLYKGIQDAITRLANRDFVREDGLQRRVDLILVDSGKYTSTVNRACRESPHANIVMPSKGIGIKAKETPMRDRRLKPGERRGHHWFRKPIPEVRSQHYLQIDTNYWKTQVHLGFATENSSPGSLELFKSPAERHRMLADHCNAETCTRVEAKDQTVEEWQLRPGSPDNHLFDNLVACLAGLSYLGCQLKSAHERKSESHVPAITAENIAKYYGST